MKEEYKKDMESLRKKKSNRNPRNKKSLKSTKKMQMKATPADWNRWKT
jgi:hypothetical protein